MLNRGIFLTIKDVQLIENCSKTTAWKRIQTLKDIFDKKSHQKVTIDEYCNYEGITKEQFLNQTDFKSIN